MPEPTDRPSLKVVKLDSNLTPSNEDIAHNLRWMADCVERDDHGLVHNAIIVLDTGPKTVVRVAGAALTRMSMVGLLEYAKTTIIEGDEL